MTRDLTTIVEAVCAAEWKRQKYAHGQQWDDLDSLVKHNAREALLPIVKATLDALDGELADAWDDGFTAGDECARAVNPEWPSVPSNPYRGEQP